jgi:hypothetical protein
MKVSEFRKLIREEVRRVLKEGGDPSLGYNTIEYFMDSNDGEATAKDARENGVSNADVVASFQSGEWKPRSFHPNEIADLATNLKMNQAEIATIATALKFTSGDVETLKTALSNLNSKLSSVLDPLIGDKVEQYDDFKIASSKVNIEITPLKNKDAEVFDILQKNKSKLSTFLRANGLPNCKLFYGTTNGYPKIVITSKPKPTSYIKASKEVQL